MKRFIRPVAAAGLAMAAAMPAMAANPISLQSEVFVERQVRGPDGTVKRVLEQPATVLPGDNLLFVLRYRNQGATPASGLVLTNPLPKAVRYSAAADAQAMVSVDGGASWGRLSQLKMRAENGAWRAARESDVTHVKWILASSLSSGAEGRIMFRGTVR